MFFRKTEVDKADLLGERLVGGATEIAATIMDELGKRFSVGYRDRTRVLDFIIEVIVFYMHLVDRLAFAYLGAVRRQVFADRIILVIMKEVLAGLSKEISADHFSSTLRERRTIGGK